MLPTPDMTFRPPLVMFKSFLEEIIGAVRPPLPVAAGVAIEAVTVGSARDPIAARPRFDDGKGWGFDDVAFRAPESATVSLSGRLGASPQGFTLGGPASIKSADLKVLMAWLEGAAAQPPGPAQSMTAHRDVTIANDRFFWLSRLSASRRKSKAGWPIPGRRATASRRA